jgi:predicted HNH restriction endonuclease
MKSFAKTAIVLVAVFSAASLLAWGQAPPAASSPTFKPVQPLKRLMEGQEQLMGRIKDEIQDKSWQEAQVSAWILAEMANVNQYQKPDAEFQALALKMSGQCVELAKVLKRRDQNAAIDQTKSVGQTCKSCHEKFRKKRGGKGKKGEGD